MRYSVLLPTRNGGDFLANCIATILGQDYDNMELIVSDNANTDSTQSVLASISDSRLKVVRSEKPVSVTENWNLALNACSGDYILMMGDDDGILPDYFEKMDRVLEKYDFPDCVTCNGYSYVNPGSIHSNTNTKSYYKDPFFKFGSDFQEGFMPPEMRNSIVKDMFQFRVRVPLNMQPHLVSRRSTNYIKGDLFRPPFPDHFALNSLLLYAKTWVFVPEKLIVVGVSPKSFGSFVFGNKENEGKTYLGIETESGGGLPGILLNNCMYAWLNLLKSCHGDKLKGVEINRSGYVRRQVYSWLQQYKAGIAKPSDMIKWFGMLSLGDWLSLFYSVVDNQSWHRLGSLVTGKNKNQVKQVFQDAIPLENIPNIAKFIDWVVGK